MYFGVTGTHHWDERNNKACKEAVDAAPEFRSCAMTACVAKIWKKVGKGSPEEVFHHCNPCLQSFCIWLFKWLWNKTIQLHTFSLSAWSKFVKSRHEKPWKIHSSNHLQLAHPFHFIPQKHLHASFGARSIKAMAAEGFHITPQFTNCATRPWRPWMKYPGGQRPEIEDITPSTDSLRKNSSGFEVGKMQVKRPQGKKLPLRWGVSTFENRVHSKQRRVGFKHGNNSSTNHLKILNFCQHTKSSLNYIFHL